MVLLVLEIVIIMLVPIVLTAVVDMMLAMTTASLMTMARAGSGNVAAADIESTLALGDRSRELGLALCDVLFDNNACQDDVLASEAAGAPKRGGAGCEHGVQKQDAASSRLHSDIKPPQPARRHQHRRGGPPPVQHGAWVTHRQPGQRLRPGRRACQVAKGDA